MSKYEIIIWAIQLVATHTLPADNKKTISKYRRNSQKCKLQHDNTTVKKDIHVNTGKDSATFSLLAN